MRQTVKRVNATTMARAKVRVTKLTAILRCGLGAAPCQSALTCHRVELKCGELLEWHILTLLGSHFTTTWKNTHEPHFSYIEYAQLLLLHLETRVYCTKPKSMVQPLQNSDQAVRQKLCRRHRPARSFLRLSIGTRKHSFVLMDGKCVAEEAGSALAIPFGPQHVRQKLVSPSSVIVTT